MRRIEGFQLFRTLHCRTDLNRASSIQQLIRIRARLMIGEDTRPSRSFVGLPLAQCFQAK
jgi:hypothetical protein